MNRTTDKQITAAVEWFNSALVVATGSSVSTTLHHGNESYGYSYWLLVDVAGAPHKQFDLGCKKGEARARLVAMTDALEFVERVRGA